MRLGVVVHIYDPGTQEMEAGRLSLVSIVSSRPMWATE